MYQEKWNTRPDVTDLHLHLHPEVLM
jgi:hypothetical protein